MRSPELLPEVKATIDRIEGWLSDREAAFLYNTARQCTGQNGVVVEIGSFKGKSTVAIGLGLQNNNPRIVAIDPHISNLEHRDQRSSLFEFQRNIARAGLADVVTLVVAKSQDVADGWFHPIELLWVDGDHSYEGAMADFELYAPHVVEGGIIAFHDATQDAVPRVVIKAFGGKGYVHVRVIDSIVYARKVTGGKKTWRDALSLRLIAWYSLLRRFRVFKPLKEPIKKALARI